MEASFAINEGLVFFDSGKIRKYRFVFLSEWLFIYEGTVDGSLTCLNISSPAKNKTPSANIDILVLCVATATQPMRTGPRIDANLPKRL